MCFIEHAMPLSWRFPDHSTLGIKYVCFLPDDINNLWEELQQEKARLKHQHEHFQEFMQHAFDEVILTFIYDVPCMYSR